MTNISNPVGRALAAAALPIALSACGGGGGNGGDSASANPATTGGRTLLAAYTVPAAIAADKVTGYATPFSAGNTFIEANCEIAGRTSSTVYVTPNFIVYATNDVSDKAQALAADLAEQGIAQVRAWFGLGNETTGFDGTNKVEVCVDNSLGQSDAETGTGLTGQGSVNVLQVISADSANFDARYPDATSFTGPTAYGSLFAHELTHVFHDTRLGIAAGGLERWFAEGLATNVADAPLPSKATILGYVNGADLITVTGSPDMNVYPAYQATVQYLLQGSGGLGFGATNIPAFLDKVKADATLACETPIQSGVTPPDNTTLGMPSGYSNGCYHSGGVVDAKVIAAFDTAFNATFKNADGTRLLLHTADGVDSLEATLFTRLDGYLQ